MTALIGRNVRIEVSKTEGASKEVTAVTLASPGVATSAAHGLTAGTVGYFSDVAGMTQIDGQAVRISAPDTNAFTMQKLDTSGYTAFTSGDFIPITAWATLSRATGYQISAAEAAKIDTTTLLDNQEQQASGLLAAQTVSIDLNGDTVDEEAYQLVEAAARAGDYLVWRITFKDGAQRVFRGQPSLPGENLGKGALATGSVSITPKGQILRLPAVS